MKLEKKQIEHIAKLARLELTEKEIEKYGGQLSAVLNYVDQLSEVNTDGIEPTAQVTGLNNVFREDAVVEWDKKEIKEALADAPELENDQVKVRRVFN